MSSMRKINENSLKEVSGGRYVENADIVKKTVENNKTNIAPGEKIGEVKLFVPGDKEEKSLI